MNKKILILSYSWSGTTTIMAQLLAKVLQTEVVDLKVSTNTFSNDMYQTSDIAQKQIAAGDLPKLENDLNLNDYDVLLIGGPVWSNDVSTPVRSLLKDLNDFNGEIAPFYTDAGSASSYEDNFKKLTNKVLPGLGMTASELNDEASATIRMQEWINQIIK